MILEACAIYDKKIGAYMLPQFFRTKGEAIRAFLDAVASESAPFAKHAEDYLFCRLGSYDDSSGGFVSLRVPEILFSALDAVLARDRQDNAQPGSNVSNGHLTV